MADAVTLPIWPYRLLRPAKFTSPRLSAQVQSSGATISGLVQNAATDAGGNWRHALQGIALRTADQVRCFDAWSAYLQGGLTECVMPVPSLLTAPRPYIGGRPATAGAPAPAADDYFNQDPGFGEPMIVASPGPDIVLRATSAVIEIIQGGALKGGELFSIEHTTLSWRLYRISRVTARTGQLFTVEFFPPCREATDDGASIEFDVPRCVMRLDPANAGDLGPGASPGRLDTVSAGFVESF
jgi:hypothetical protein